MLLSLVTLTMLHLAGGLVLSALAQTTPADDCSKLPVPSWTISNLKIQSRDTVGNTGTAAFTLTYGLTGKSDALNCSLVANYRCEIDGPPGNKNLKVNLQVQNDVAYFSLSEQLSCDNSS